LGETQPLRLRTVAALSLLFTYFFFIEYLPPFQHVHIPYDLDGFHYPLFDYTFRALGNGRFPEWDPTIYCGLSFVGNVQAALFYPPSWLIFAASAGREHVSYAVLEIVVVLHVWLAFVLCYGWLRANGLRAISSALGAAVLALSGYLLLQLQHFGVTAGYAWMPLGLWGIDDGSRSGWRSLWKLAVASAMCFLAGYPPLWTVFGVCMLAYALCRKTPLQVLLGTGAALAFSVLLSAVQLLPALQASALKVFEARYGSGFRDPKFYISYFIPNYYDFGLHVDPMTNFGREYLYLGAAALFGLCCTPRARLRSVAPALGMLAATAIALTNAFNLVARIVEHSSLLMQVCRDWYFLAGITLAAAPLAAAGIDAFLDRRSTPPPRPVTAAAAALLALWAVYLLVQWRRDAFRAGPRSILEPAVALALVWLAMYALRAASGSRRILLATMLLIAVAAEYKAFGTAKRFNAGLGKVPRPVLLTGSDRSVARELQENAVYRIVLDETAPFPPSLRSFGLTTPQGFDPMITTQYRDVIQKIGHFRTNWLIDFDPAKVEALRLLGVRYYITSEGGTQFAALSRNPAFRPLGPPVGYYRVFELIDASPPYACEACTARSVRWEPEHREFLVRSAGDARLALIEQAFPGWSVHVDNGPARMEPYGGAFQSVRVSAGLHRITFDYRSTAMRIGGAISVVSVVALVLFTTRFRPARDRAATAAPAVRREL